MTVRDPRNIITPDAFTVVIVDGATTVAAWESVL